MEKFLNKQQFITYSNLIEDYSGIHLEPERLDDLSLALAQRANELSIDFDKYLILLEQSKADEELKQIVGCITINETNFIRYPEQYSVLQKVVIPEIIAKKQKQEINIWSAGCSSGEEPYSIAIALSEIIPHFTIKVLATDIDKDALARAKKAIYSPRSIRLLSNERLKNYFNLISPEEYALKSKVKSMVTFAQHNIVSLKPPTGFTNFDIIFCRNVLIYFNKQTIAKIIDHFYRQLNPYGYLFLGHSESLYSISARFYPREVNNAYIYQKLESDDQRIINRFFNKTVLDSKTEITEIKPAKNQKELTLETKMEADHKENFSKALEHYKNKKLPETLKVLEDIGDNGLKTGLLKAQSLLEIGKSDEAKEQCIHLLQKDSLSGYPYFVLGLIALKENKEDEAIDSFRRAAYSLSDFGLPHFFLANIYRKKGNKRAKFEYSKCTELLKKHSNEDIWQILSPRFSPSAVIKSCQQALSHLK